MKNISTIFIALIGFIPSPAFADGAARSVIEPLLSIFRNDQTSLYIGGAMIISALILVIIHNLRVHSPLKRDIKRANKAFSRADSPETFFENFEYIENLISKQKFIFPVWLEFKETMNVYTKEDGSGVWQNTKRPQDYFTLSTLSRQRGNVNALDFWPNVFVGSGLLFTFLGLIAAIDQAGVAIEAASQDVGEVMRALEIMLTIASIKFITSVAGIICSIGIAGFSKKMQNTLSNETGRLHERMEKCLEFLSIERLQRDTIIAIERMSNSITKGVADGVTKVAGNELRDFASTLGTITPTLANLQKELSEFGILFTQKLETINLAFIDTFSKTTENLSTWQDNFILNLEESTNKASETLHEYNDQLSKNIKESLVHFKKINMASSSSITTITDSFERASNDLSLQLDQQIKFSQKQHDEINSSSQNFSKQSEILINTLTELIKGIRESLNNFDKSNTYYSDINKQFTLSITELTFSFETLSEALSTKISQQNEQSEKHLTELDKSTKLSTLKSDELITVLADSIKSNSNNGEQLLTSISQIQKELPNFYASISTNTEKIEKAIITFTDKLNRQGQISDTDIKDISQTLIMIETISAQYTQQIKNLNDNMSTHLTKLNIAVVQLIQKVDDTSKTKKRGLFNWDKSE